MAPATSVADETARKSQFTSAFAGLSGNASAFSDRFDPRYNTVGYLESSANSEYHGLQIELQKRVTKGLFFNLSYTWAKSIDDNSDALGVLSNDSSAQQNPRDNRNNRGPSQFDLQHTFVLSHNYTLPFFQKSSSKLVKYALSGWSIGGITSLRSGFPVNIFAGPRLGLTDSIAALGGSAVDRPNVSGAITNFNPQPAGSPGNPASLGLVTVNGVKESAFAYNLGLTQPLLGNFGSLGRNVLRLNGQMNFDWDVYKNFSIKEKVNLQVRSEFYNMLNSVAFQGFASSTITSQNFGVYNTLSQNPRLIQAAVRLVF